MPLVAYLDTWYLLLEKLVLLFCPFIFQIHYWKYALQTTLPFHWCDILHITMYLSCTFTRMIYNPILIHQEYHLIYIRF